MDEPFLQSAEVECSKNSAYIFLSTKWVLRFVMWVIFVAWIALIFLYPGELGDKLFSKWVGATSSTPFGTTGSYLLAFSGPIVVLALLAIAYLLISDEEVFTKKKSKSPSFRLWTYPVLVDGPFGVVSASEFLGIVAFAAFLLWAVYAYTMRNLSLLSEFHFPNLSESLLMLEITGVRFGMIGLLCMAFLFLPISRGSVLLRLVDIPFEHATRYHVWLGHITMLFFTLHGLCFVIGWSIEGTFWEEMMSWRPVGFAILPGVVSLLAGLLMWVTSLGPVRKRYFELFFYTHQLYVVFVVFLALHVGDHIFSITAGGIFLFILDRFLRFCQSRRKVDILSAKSLPCGTVELILSKPAKLGYNALSFVFLQIRELSWLQWHPFSVSSSPLDGKHHLAVLIKVLGGWTGQLRDSIEAMHATTALQDLPSQNDLRLTASIEGPYGHESPYHLMYENLVLVAGGIGISPFFAILNDITHRIGEGKPCLPNKVLVVWAIKTSDELSLLSTIDLESICPFYSERLSLEIQIYVTRESEPPLEGGAPKGAVCSVWPATSGCRMSVLVGTGDKLWSGLYVIISTVGFVCLLFILQIFYINKFNVTYWWYKGLLFVGCMVASVLIFGGGVVYLWHLWGRTTKTGEEQEIVVDSPASHRTGEQKVSTGVSMENTTTLRYGSRPDFEDVFGSIHEKWGGVDVGVIVCGPSSLQSSVAKEIRWHNLQRSSQHPILHFNTHSFDL